MSMLLQHGHIHALQVFVIIIIVIITPIRHSTKTMNHYRYDASDTVEIGFVFLA